MTDIERIAICQNVYGDASWVALDPGEALMPCHEPGCQCVRRVYIDASTVQAAVKALRRLAEIHHRTVTPSKLHDPRSRDWTECECNSCRLAQPFGDR